MDAQGVLSLQFMIEVEAPVSGNTSGAVAVSEKLSYVDFLFIPVIEEDGDEAEGGEGEGDVDETMMNGNQSVDDDENML
jgi:cell cycle checkpoint protein